MRRAQKPSKMSDDDRKAVMYKLCTNRGVVSRAINNQTGRSGRGAHLIRTLSGYLHYRSSKGAAPGGSWRRGHIVPRQCCRLRVTWGGITCERGRRRMVQLCEAVIRAGRRPESTIIPGTMSSGGSYSFNIPKFQFAGPVTGGLRIRAV